MDRIRFNKLLPKFKAIWTPGEKFGFWRQAFDKNPSLSPKAALGYHKQNSAKNPDRVMTDRDWLLHFSQAPSENNQFILGAYAVCGKFEDRLVRWFCWDGDSKEETIILMDKVIPWLESHGIEHILEFSQVHRCHLWVMVDSVEYDICESFVNHIQQECGTSREVYPFDGSDGKRISRSSLPVRIPGGWHYWTQKANPCLFKDYESSDPCDIMEMFINAKPLTKAHLLSIHTPEEKRTYTKKKAYKPFKYMPVNLPKVWDNQPPVADAVLSNCQAMHELAVKAKYFQGIEIPGAEYHEIGMKLSGMFLYNDIVLKDDKGRKLWEWVVSTYRDRSGKSHGWNGDANYHKYNDNPAPLLPNCKTMDKEFNLCKGCPYYKQDGFWNVRQLYTGTQTERFKVKEPKILTLNEIRNTLFPEIRRHVFKCVDEGRSEDILIATPQGSGKSVFAKDLVVDLVAYGKNAVIAVHDAESAVSYQKALAAEGINALVWMSHKNTFKPDSPRDLTFDCPDYDNIQYYAKLGCDSSYWKNRFCKSCKVESQCPYPKQYSKILEPDIHVVIIQHAHFRSTVSMMQLINSGKQFHAMIIDERFIKNLIDIVKPLPLEYEILLNTNMVWAQELGTWMRDGGYQTSQKLYPNQLELEEVGLKFQDNNLDPERLRSFRNAYNSGIYMSKLVGMRQFFELPRIPIRVFTDATPNIDKIKIVLNNQDLKVFGKGVVIDITDYHPDNRLINVIDSSVSRSALAANDGERFYDNLNIVGEKCLTEHKEGRGLVTVYADQEEIAIDYLKSKFNLDVGGFRSGKRIIVDHMRMGTNEYVGFSFQFMLASVYLNPKEAYKDVYEIMTIENYFRKKSDLPTVNNPYIKDAMETSGAKIGVEMTWLPAKVVLRDGVYIYPFTTVPIPQEERFRWYYEECVASGQQSSRLRVWEGMTEPITIYKFSSQYMKGLVGTEVKTYDQIWGQIS